MTVDLRVVIASVDTYLRYAEGVERLQVYDRSGSKRLPDMVGSATKGSALKKGAEKVGEAITGNGKHGEEGQQEDDEGGFTGTIKRGVRNIVGKLTDSSDEDDEKGKGDEGQQERRPQKQGARR